MGCATWFSAVKNQNSKTKNHIAFPVILSTGSHPFPSRTRKLSLLEPMVLRGKLRGRVGSRRDYFKSPLVNSSGLFLLSDPSCLSAFSAFARSLLALVCALTDMNVSKWIKRLGFWGFLFFLVKGLFWLLGPTLLAFWVASSCSTRIYCSG